MLSVGGKADAVRAEAARLREVCVPLCLAGLLDRTIDIEFAEPEV